MALIVVAAPIWLGFTVGGSTNFILGLVTWFVASWVLGMMYQAVR